MAAIHFITRANFGVNLVNGEQRLFAKFKSAVSWAQDQWPDADIEMDGEQGTAVVRDRKQRVLCTMHQVELH